MVCVCVFNNYYVVRLTFLIRLQLYGEIILTTRPQLLIFCMIKLFIVFAVDDFDCYARVKEWDVFELRLLGQK